jgi:glycosyltransferase involved in cell wall biosynthesis
MAMEWRPDIVEYADIDAEGLFHPGFCPCAVKLHMSHKVMRPFYSSKELQYNRRVVEGLESRFLTRADGLSSPSNWLIGEVTRMEGIAAASIAFVPNPIDTKRFSPHAISGKGLVPTVLYVGRLEPRKGALVFAESIPLIAGEFPEARFAFVGADRPSTDGTSQREALRSFFDRERIAGPVTFHGHDSESVYREFYQKATVFVMPSLLENCPYTLLEAMACGLPVVVSDCSGLSEIVADGRTGILFPAGSATELARHVVALLRSPARRRKLGEAARRAIMQRYSLEVCAEATERFYYSLISKREDTNTRTRVEH